MIHPLGGGSESVPLKLPLCICYVRTQQEDIVYEPQSRCSPDTLLLINHLESILLQQPEWTNSRRISHADSNGKAAGVSPLRSQDIQASLLFSLPPSWNEPCLQGVNTTLFLFNRDIAPCS
jgi:hypothetical protein